MAWQAVIPPPAFTVYWLPLLSCCNYSCNIPFRFLHKHRTIHRINQLFYIGRAQKLRINNRVVKTVNAELRAVLNIAFSYCSHWLLTIFRHSYFKQTNSETTTTTLVYPVILSLEMREKNCKYNITYFSLLKKVCLAVDCAGVCAHALAEE
jgi:hypothetical protein